MGTRRLLRRGIPFVSPWYRYRKTFESHKLLSSRNKGFFSDEDLLKKEYDSNLYRNDVQVIGKASADPFAIHGTSTGSVIGYRFPLEIKQQDFKAVNCAVVVYQSANSAVSEFVAGNIRMGQILKIKGFFRKSIKEETTQNGRTFKVFYTIGPKSVEIVDSDGSSSS